MEKPHCHFNENYPNPMNTYINPNGSKMWVFGTEVGGGRVLNCYHKIRVGLTSSHFSLSKNFFWVKCGCWMIYSSGNILFLRFVSFQAFTANSASKPPDLRGGNFLLGPLNYISREEEILS